MEESRYCLSRYRIFPTGKNMDYSTSQYKFLSLTYKCIYGLAPLYLQEQGYKHTRNLLSSSQLNIVSTACTVSILMVTAHLLSFRRTIQRKFPMHVVNCQMPILIFYQAILIQNCFLRLKAYSLISYERRSQKCLKNIFCLVAFLQKKHFPK